MTKNKCSQCGLVNFAQVEFCKRCKASLSSNLNADANNSNLSKRKKITNLKELHPASLLHKSAQKSSGTKFIDENGNVVLSALGVKGFLILLTTIVATLFAGAVTGYLISEYSPFPELKKWMVLLSTVPGIIVGVLTWKFLFKLLESKD